MNLPVKRYLCIFGMFWFDVSLEVARVLASGRSCNHNKRNTGSILHQVQREGIDAHNQTSLQRKQKTQKTAPEDRPQRGDSRQLQKPWIDLLNCGLKASFYSILFNAHYVIVPIGGRRTEVKRAAQPRSTRGPSTHLVWLRANDVQD